MLYISVQHLNGYWDMSLHDLSRMPHAARKLLYNVLRKPGLFQEGFARAFDPEELKVIRNFACSVFTLQRTLEEGDLSESIKLILGSKSAL